MSENRRDWFLEIADRLRDYPEGEIWSSGDEILCRTESAVNTLMDMLKALYHAQGVEVDINTGYYDPEEDKKNGEEDKYTGWWYINVE